ERKVSDANVVQESQPLANLTHDAVGDYMLPFGQLERFEKRQRVGNRKIDIFRQAAAFHANRPAFRTQTLPLTRGARSQRAIRLQRLLIGPGSILESAP